MEGHGYLPNTPDDREGLIVIFAAVGMCWSITVMVFRLSGSLLVRQRLDIGDWTIVALTCLGTACSVAIFLAVKYGLGERSEMRGSSNDDSAAKALYASDIIYLFTLGTSQVATILLVRNLSPGPRHKQASDGLSAVVVLWTISGIFAIALRCNLAAPALDLSQSQCSSLFPRWASIEGIGICTEVAIVGLTAVMIYDLQMAISKKLMALVILAVRLPVIIAVAFRLKYLNQAFRSNDYLFHATGAVIAGQCVLHYSIMSTSFFYLKPFLAAFDSNLGASTKLDTIVATGSSGRRDGSRSNSRSWHTAMQSSRRASTHTSAHALSKSQSAGLPRTGSRDSNAPIIWETRSYQVEVE